MTFSTFKDIFIIVNMLSVIRVLSQRAKISTESVVQQSFQSSQRAVANIKAVAIGTSTKVRFHLHRLVSCENVSTGQAPN